MYEGKGYQDADAEAMHPLLHLLATTKPRPAIAPGQRVRMNVVPMFVGTFLPWGVFIFCCGLSSFWLNYMRPALVSGLICAVFLFWLAWMVAAIMARLREPDPTWFTYMAVAVGVAAISGTTCGQMNFTTFARPFYLVNDLKVASDVDTSHTPARNVMDAGIVHFKAGSHFDQHKSWHFKNDHLYCVAPVVSRGPEPAVHDYWIVGKDCCSMLASDFRCGAWGSTRASGGIRVVDDVDLANYRLAVQQAASLYELQASNPVFLTWSADPVVELSSWSQIAMKNYLTQVATALVFCVFFMCMATVKFAWLGRVPSHGVLGLDPYGYY